MKRNGAGRTREILAIQLALPGASVAPRYMFKPRAPIVKPRGGAKPLARQLPLPGIHMEENDAKTN